MVNLLTSTTTGNACARVITQTWDAVDACNNHSATRTQVITITDTQAPTIGAAGADATIECTGTPTFTARTAEHTSELQSLKQFTSPPTLKECARVITQTWDAVDACNNHS